MQTVLPNSHNVDEVSKLDSLYTKWYVSNALIQSKQKYLFNTQVFEWFSVILYCAKMQFQFFCGLLRIHKTSFNFNNQSTSCSVTQLMIRDFNTHIIFNSISQLSQLVCDCMYYWPQQSTRTKCKVVLSQNSQAGTEPTSKHQLFADALEPFLL